MYSCHLFLISSASVRSIPFLSFIEPIFGWNVPLVSLIFLTRSLVFPVLLFSCISLHWSLRKVFLSLLAVVWNSAFRWVYLSFSPLPFVSCLFSLFVRRPQTTILSLHFFLLGMFLITASGTNSLLKEKMACLVWVLKEKMACLVWGIQLLRDFYLITTLLNLCYENFRT